MVGGGVSALLVGHETTGTAPGPAGGTFSGTPVKTPLAEVVVGDVGTDVDDDGGAGTVDVVGEVLSVVAVRPVPPHPAATPATTSTARSARRGCTAPFNHSTATAMCEAGLPMEPSYPGVRHVIVGMLAGRRRRT